MSTSFFCEHTDKHQNGVKMCFSWTILRFPILFWNRFFSVTTKNYACIFHLKWVKICLGWTRYNKARVTLLHINGIYILSVYKGNIAPSNSNPEHPEASKDDHSKNKKKLGFCLFTSKFSKFSKNKSLYYTHYRITHV